MALVIDAETLAYRLDDLMEKGLLSDEEARQEWLAAQEEAMEEVREGWCE